jgi:hypothetical protein
MGIAIMKLRRIVRTTFLLGCTGLMIVSFQNCSDLSLQDQVLHDQAVYDLRTDLDNNELPQLLVSSSIQFWSKPSNPSYIDNTPFFGQKWSMIVVADTAITGKILGLNSGTNSDEGYISVQSGAIRVTHMSTATDYSYIEVPVPSGSKMSIAVEFGTTATDMSLLVNGTVQNVAITKVGSPIDYSYLQKSMTAAGTGGVIYEAMIYSDALSKPDLNALARYTGSDNSMTNVVFDPTVFDGSGSGTTTQDPLFVAAKAVIDANCTGCHSSASNGDFRNMTVSKAVQNGWIVPGNPTSSPLYYRLVGSSGSNGPKNMPQGGSLSASDVQAISDWITNAN